MTRERCTNCGIEEWAEKMHFCANDGMWFCTRCGVFMGLADSDPRCPRCYEKLIQRRVASGAPRRTAGVVLLVALATTLVVAPANGDGVRRHLTAQQGPCSLVIASSEYEALRIQSQRFMSGTPDERTAAAAYLTGLDQSDPTFFSFDHNVTVHRVLAPAFCHVHLGLDRATGAAMLWAVLKAHDGLSIGGRTLWGGWLSGYQLSQAIATYELLAADNDGLLASSPFNEIPSILTRAIGDFASVNSDLVSTPPGDLLVDTRFEDNALDFVGWAFAASFWARQGDAGQEAEAITKAEAFWFKAFHLEHFCWIPQGLPPEDLSSSQCRQDVAALLAEDTAHQLNPDAAPAPRIMVFNHAQEDPYYGVGILNNMARGVQILRDLGVSPLKGPAEFQPVVAGIYRWAQSHVRADGAYQSPSDGPGAGCLVTTSSGSGSSVLVEGGRAVTAYCGDNTSYGGYSPKHAPLIGFFSLIGGYPTGAVDGYQFTEFDPRTDIHDYTTGERYPFFPAIWPSPPRFGLDNGRLVFNGVFGHELMKGLPTAPR